MSKVCRAWSSLPGGEDASGFNGRSLRARATASVSARHQRPATQRPAAPAVARHYTAWSRREKRRGGSRAGSARRPDVLLHDFVGGLGRFVLVVDHDRYLHGGPPGSAPRSGPRRSSARPISVTVSQCVTKDEGPRSTRTSHSICTVPITSRVTRSTTGLKGSGHLATGAADHSCFAARALAAPVAEHSGQSSLELTNALSSWR